MVFKNENLLSDLQNNNLIPLQYVDDDNNSTTKYPMNPNGSVLGIAGVCSQNGRHLAMMPHPERCTRVWQWPMVPKQWTEQFSQAELAPWAKMFSNAYDWCIRDL